MGKLVVNLIAVNAKSGAGKDYIVSNFNFIEQYNTQFRNVKYVEGKNYIWDNLQDHTGIADLDDIINNPIKYAFLLKKLHEVSSSEIKTEIGIDWGRTDLLISRFSTPLRTIVQAVAGTNFTMEEMDSQDVKKFQPEHLDEDFRMLHLVLSDAVKEKLNRPDIFATLLEKRVKEYIVEKYLLIPPISSSMEVITIIIQDMRYPEEITAVNNIKKFFADHENIHINLNKIYITSKKFNEINHSSEQDLFGQFPNEFDSVFENSQTRTTAETLAAVKTEIYEPIIKSLNNGI